MANLYVSPFEQQNVGSVTVGIIANTIASSFASMSVLAMAKHVFGHWRTYLMVAVFYLTYGLGPLQNLFELITSSVLLLLAITPVGFSLLVMFGYVMEIFFGDSSFRESKICLFLLGSTKGFPTMTVEQALDQAARRREERKEHERVTAILDTNKRHERWTANSYGTYSTMPRRSRRHEKGTRHLMQESARIDQGHYQRTQPTPPQREWTREQKDEMYERGFASMNRSRYDTTDYTPYGLLAYQGVLPPRRPVYNSYSSTMLPTTFNAPPQPVPNPNPLPILPPMPFNPINQPMLSSVSRVPWQASAFNRHARPTNAQASGPFNNAVTSHSSGNAGATAAPLLAGNSFTGLTGQGSSNVLGGPVHRNAACHAGAAAAPPAMQNSFTGVIGQGSAFIGDTAMGNDTSGATAAASLPPAAEPPRIPIGMGSAEPSGSIETGNSASNYGAPATPVVTTAPHISDPGQLSRNISESRDKLEAGLAAMRAQSGVDSGQSGTGMAVAAPAEDHTMGEEEADTAPTAGPVNSTSVLDSPSPASVQYGQTQSDGAQFNVSAPPQSSNTSAGLGQPQAVATPAIPSTSETSSTFSLGGVYTTAAPNSNIFVAPGSTSTTAPLLGNGTTSGGTRSQPAKSSRSGTNRGRSGNTSSSRATAIRRTAPGTTTNTAASVPIPAPVNPLLGQNDASQCSVIKCWISTLVSKLKYLSDPDESKALSEAAVVQILPEITQRFKQIVDSGIQFPADPTSGQRARKAGLYPYCDIWQVVRKKLDHLAQTPLGGQQAFTDAIAAMNAVRLLMPQDWRGWKILDTERMNPLLNHGDRSAANSEMKLWIGHTVSIFASGNANIEALLNDPSELNRESKKLDEHLGLILDYCMPRYERGVPAWDEYNRMDHGQANRVGIYRHKCESFWSVQGSLETLKDSGSAAVDASALDNAIGKMKRIRKAQPAGWDETKAK